MGHVHRLARALGHRLARRLARTGNGATRSGAFLDPLADKLLVLGGFVALGVRGDFPWIAVAIVAVREIGVSIWRSVEIRRGVSFPARPLGKWKANVQFLAVAAVLFPPTADVEWFSDTVLWLAVAMTVISAIDLVVHAYRYEPEPLPAKAKR